MSTALPQHLRVRRPSRADVRPIFDLVATSDLADIGEVDYEEGDVVADLTRPRLDLARDYWLVAEGERLMGAASVLGRIDSPLADGDLVVHPEADPAVGPHLLELLAARAAEQAAVAGQPSAVVAVATTTTDLRGARELADAGYSVVRRFSRMILDLEEEPPAVSPEPPGLAVHRVAGETDRSDLHAVMTTSFADHFGSTPEPYEEWWARQSGRSGFDESLWWLVDVDGGPVGGLIGRTMAEQGWVQGVGVLPAYRGRGRARRLLLTAFAEFHRRGLPRVGLGVDTGNDTGALALYESVGMRRAQQHAIWHREVPASTE